MPTASITKKEAREAIEVLDGVITIAAREQLIRGRYITGVMTPELEGKSICNGRKACLVGSLLIAGGQEPYLSFGDWELKGSYLTNREEVMETLPGVLLAYETLCELATRKMEADDRVTTAHEYADDDDDQIWVDLENPAESYFEDYLPFGAGDSKMEDMVILLCQEAKEAIAEKALL